jgi:hypothetical protein
MVGTTGTTGVGLVGLPFQAFGLINAQLAIFLLPAIVPVLGDAELATRLDNCTPLAHLTLDGVPMDDDVFCRVPFPCHAPFLRQRDILTPDLI